MSLLSSLRVSCLRRVENPRLAVASALLLAACSGDVTPLSEAIEVRALNLGSLSIERPPGTLVPFLINRGERVSFTLSGLDVDGRVVDPELLGGERNWRVSDPTVASIDENGELIGLQDGDVEISVNIGDIVAPVSDLEVRNASFQQIERIVGTDELDACRAERFTAIGRFNDDSERLLRDVAWTTQTPGAELQPSEDDGSTQLSGSMPGDIELVATVDSVSLSRLVDVNATLTGLLITPTQALSAAENQSVQLSAVGTYERSGDGAPFTSDITRTVVWETELGAEFATVSNEPETRGLVSTTNAGTAQFGAACDLVLADPRTFLVRDASTSSGSDAGELSFEAATGAGSDGDGGSRLIALGNTVQLRVSTGSEYDEDDDVTSEALWSLVNPGETPVATLDVEGLDRGTFTALRSGAIQVRVIYENLTATLDITVN